MLTTLLAPTEGRIRIFGYDIARDPYPAKRHMGLVPEESNVYTELSAWDDLMFTAKLYRVPAGEREQRGRELRRQAQGRRSPRLLRRAQRRRR